MRFKQLTESSKLKEDPEYEALLDKIDNLTRELEKMKKEKERIRDRYKGN